MGYWKKAYDRIKGSVILKIHIDLDNDPNILLDNYGEVAKFVGERVEYKYRTEKNKAKGIPLWKPIGLIPLIILIEIADKIDEQKLENQEKKS